MSNDKKKDARPGLGEKLKYIASLLCLTGVLLTPHFRKKIASNLEKPDESLNEDNLNVHNEYLINRKYYVENANQVQRDLDQSLLNLGGGALALSITILQLTSFPVTHLSYLFASWIILGFSVFFSITGMCMSRLRFEFERDREDVEESQRQELEQREKTGWEMICDKAAWLHSEMMIGIVNHLVILSLAAGIILMASFTWENTMFKNTLEKEKAENGRRK